MHLLLKSPAPCDPSALPEEHNAGINKKTRELHHVVSSLCRNTTYHSVLKIIILCPEPVNGMCKPAHKMVSQYQSEPAHVHVDLAAHCTWPIRLERLHQLWQNYPLVPCKQHMPGNKEQSLGQCYSPASGKTCPT